VTTTPDRPARRRLLLPGQWGPAFDDGGAVLVVEALDEFSRRPLHRAKAHLWLSALRPRVAELGDRAEHVRVDRLADALTGRGDLEVVDPPSRHLRAVVRAASPAVVVLPSRGFVTSEADFADWVAARPGRLLMEDFYEAVRRREGFLMEGPAPVGGRFSYDDENRHAPPRGAAGLGLPDPVWPVEDEIDAEVRDQLDAWRDAGLVTFVGEDDRRRFAVTAEEAEAALEDFVETRLGDFGPFEDAMLSGDWTMAHSLLSVPMNLGVLDPRHVVERVLRAHEGGAPLASVEGFVRQVVGWRDWVWHLYWHLGESYVDDNDALGARVELPAWWRGLDSSEVEAACLSDAIDVVSRHGWTHHIQRLMILGNWSLQRGYRPDQLTEWFTDVFVDGTDWVMPANIVGMSQHADGGVVATKPYAAGGRYIDTMSDHCGSCRFSPTVRVGDDACPFTAGYWAFLHRAEPALRDNARMRNPLRQMRGLDDLEAVVAQEAAREMP
jgi:deoxyribodipyrimidine photolyase-related protein